jgi:hypothetical protein
MGVPSPTVKASGAAVTRSIHGGSEMTNAELIKKAGTTGGEK